jgi:hypothetical protein
MLQPRSGMACGQIIQCMDPVNSFAIFAVNVRVHGTWALGLQRAAVQKTSRIMQISRRVRASPTR